MLAELERDGVVAQARDERDRRRNVVTLTRIGNVAIARLDRQIAAAL
jgi:DNA-binding MarR family transcriptional regulator